MNVTDFTSFVEYCKKHITGDEKGEAQLFLDHFFHALGYADGLKGAGANCEFRIKDERKGSTRFADLVWKKVVLVEMKKRGEDLSLHIQQAFSYWMNIAPDRPRYVILCNFDEFWIYDLNIEVYKPMEKVQLEQLHERQEAFSFMLPKPRNPIFNYNREDVTEAVSKLISPVYHSIVKRGVDQNVTLKYCMQMVLCLFAEDVGLLPDHIFTRIIKELQEGNEGEHGIVVESYDVISNLFIAMNTKGITPGGKYKGVDYFNGGLFDTIYPIELNKWELSMISAVAQQNWRHVNPAIFGSIFESSLGDERHKLGAHYTHEFDIKKVVDPVIVKPWLEKIENAQTLDDNYDLLEQLAKFKVLDPACGSGNFLFVAYKEMKLLEKKILQNIKDMSAKPADAKRLSNFLLKYKFVTTDQFYGIDIKPFAAELAKVTLMIAKEITCLESKNDHDNKLKPLPLDNLDANIVCRDSLLDADGNPAEWPGADAIVGNPPYQSKNKMQQEFGVEYMNKLRAAYPGVPGRADFCVYWFNKAHQHLKPGCFAGLVGTNTIRQNYSREGSLDYIVNNGGTIVNAVSSQDWSGEAAVYVSIVDWKKGPHAGKKVLTIFDDKGEHNINVQTINSSLSLETDVSSAHVLKANTTPKCVFQGQTHGHEGFLVPKAKAIQILKKNPGYAPVLKPFLNGDELVAGYKSQPNRFVIDFTGKDIIETSKYKELYKQLQKDVLPEITKKAEAEKNGITKPNGREAWLNTWWLMWRRREDMLNAISKIPRFISCARVTKRPIFEFISSQINPNDALMVFPYDDDYSFGIISSSVHWSWFKEKCSTLKGDYRYTTESVWDTFPWPQHPTAKQVENVARAARALRDTRTGYMQKNGLSLRDLYRTMEKPGKNPVKDLQAELDKAVMDTYGFSGDADLLQQLLDLNLALHGKEESGEPIQAPGIPDGYTTREKITSDDCVRFDEKVE